MSGSYVLSGSPRRVQTGSYHSCAILSDKTLRCWGSNSAGQLGDGTTDNRATPTPVVGLTSGVVSVATGDTHTCAALESGAVYCSGGNGDGQLGDGTMTSRLVPTPVAGITSGAMAVAVNEGHSCALFDSGAVKCWGYNGSGQLGDASTTNRLTPTQVTGLSAAATRISLGRFHTCALLNTGTPVCWGGNADGQLGDGTTTNRITPTGVASLTSGALDLSANWGHTYAVMDNHTVKCWGSNWGGQIGDGTTTTRPLPTDVVGLTAGAARVTAGWSHTCATLETGGVQCWGNNDSGALGNSTNLDSTEPKQVSDLTSEVADIAAGGAHTCVSLATGGVVKCWGLGYSGQLGDGSLGYSSTFLRVNI